jgi:hypothetical protein
MPLPTPPAAPSMPKLSSRDEPGIDKDVLGAVDQATPRSIALNTKGPLRDVESFNQDYMREMNRRAKLPTKAARVASFKQPVPTTGRKVSR